MPPILPHRPSLLDTVVSRQTGWVRLRCRAGVGPQRTTPRLSLEVRWVARRSPAATGWPRGLLRPLLALLTRRDWRGGEHVPREGGIVVVVQPHLARRPVPGRPLPGQPREAAAATWARSRCSGSPSPAASSAGAGQIPVYRETADASQSYSEAVKAVQAGECVVIYPEGTLTRDPDLWPMRGKTGAARVALETGCPVIPVAQWGAHRILSPYGRRPQAPATSGPPRLRRTAGRPVCLRGQGARHRDAARGRRTRSWTP